MKKTNFKLAVATIVLLGASVASATDYRMDLSKLQIGAGCIAPCARDEAHIRDIRDCGINFVYGIPSTDRTALDLCAKYGVGVIATGAVPFWHGMRGDQAGKMRELRPMANYLKAIRAYVDHPAIWMIDVVDEPSALDYPYIGEVFRELSKRVPKDVLLYHNLYPNYARASGTSKKQTRNQLGRATYGEYAADYFTSVPLPYASFDFYVYWNKESDKRKVKLEQMHDNFRILAENCRKHGKSLWYVGQVNSRYPNLWISENQLRFQAYMALCYGAQAVEWCCWSRVPGGETADMPGVTGWWTNNVLTMDGEKTQQYEKLKRVNGELHALGPKYMAYCTVATRRTEDGVFVVGDMVARDGSGRRAQFVLAAADPFDDHPQRQRYVINASSARVFGGNGEIPVVRGEDGTLSFELAANAGVLVEYVESSDAVSPVAAAFGGATSVKSPIALPDVLTSAALGDIKVLGHVGDVQQAFFKKRVFSDFAKNEIWKEAREAFAHPDDDTIMRPWGMWKGEFWGKLMISACRVADYSHDESLKKFLHEEALRLIRYQQADGYLGTYADRDWVTAPDVAEVRRIRKSSSAFNWSIWCRKYTLWGLLACYRLTGDRALLDSAERLASQLIDSLRRQHLKIADTGTLAMRGLPPCSILKPILWLYKDTGKAEYLAFAKEIYASWSDPTSRAPQFAAKLATGRPIQDWYPTENGYWGKAYEMMSCLAGMVELARVTGDRAPLDLTVALQNRIYADERNLCCSVGYNDQFWGSARHLNGVSEPCDAIHWIRLNHELFLATGEAKYVDAIEETFYNALLASISADRSWGARCVRSHGRHQSAPPQCTLKHQHCCVNNLPRGLLDAAETMVAHDAKGILHVALYHDAVVTAGGDRVAISGGFPIKKEVTLRVERKKGGKMRLRVPAWCRRLSVEGSGAVRSFERSGWAALDAPSGTSEWKLVFDMNPRLVESTRAPIDKYPPREDLARRWAVNRTSPGGEADLVPLLRKRAAAQVMYGPLLLAKSVRLGATAAELLDETTVNGGGWRLTVEPSLAADVWGCWNLIFEKDGVKRSAKACDYPSAAIWSSDKIEFSTLF